VSPGDVAIAVAVGLASGILAGIFGVGGGIAMTPGIQVFLGLPPVVALATPLPAIFPTALAGALAYRRQGELDTRAAVLLIVPGLFAAAIGAWLTDLVDTTLLLLITAVLLGSQAIAIVRGGRRGERDASEEASAPILAGIGVTAGFVSGLLGIGGGIVIVPLLAGWLGMPLKRALGTSLLAISVLVIPGSIVHAALGHIDLGVCLALAVGAVPGARIGAALALGTRERTLRLVVGSGLLAVSVAYGIDQVVALRAR
jgi:uncharacterized membrane protein YfcA